MDYRALQAEIQADADCAPHMHTNAMEKIDGPAAFAKDSAIAAIRNGKRPKVFASRIITERGIREVLEVEDGALLLKTLRELSEATQAPAWLGPALTAAQIPTAKHWAYFDTLQCGWGWLKGDGLELAAAKTRLLLDMLAAAVVVNEVHVLATACATLKALPKEQPGLSAADVSRAMRGPWGDE